MSPIVLGALGGLVPDAIRLVKGRYDTATPAYLKTWWFWIGLGMCVVLGAVAAYLSHVKTPIAALACGFSAPEILTRLLSREVAPAPAAMPAPAPRRAEAMSLRTWWAR